MYVIQKSMSVLLIFKIKVSSLTSFFPLFPGLDMKYQNTTQVFVQSEEIEFQKWLNDNNNDNDNDRNNDNGGDDDDDDDDNNNNNNNDNDIDDGNDNDNDNDSDDDNK